MKEKIIVFFICLSMFASSVIYAKEKKEIPGSAIFVMAMPKQMILQEKTIDYEDLKVQIHIKIPQINGLGDKKFQKLMNEYFEREAIKLKRLFVKEVESLSTEKESFQVPYKINGYYSVKDTPNALLSIERVTATTRGSGNTFVESDCITIDKINNKVLVLKDFFRKDQSLQEKINHYLNQVLSFGKQEEDSFTQNVQGFQTVKGNQPFYINAEGNLVLLFNLYEVEDCKESGIIKIEIPKEIYNFW